MAARLSALADDMLFRHTYKEGTQYHHGPLNEDFCWDGDAWIPREEYEARKERIDGYFNRQQQVFAAGNMCGKTSLSAMQIQMMRDALTR